MTVDTLVAVFKADIKDFVAGAAKVDRSFRGMSRVSVWSMARVGSAVADAGRKMLGFAKDTIKVGMEFEQAMSNLRAVLPTTDQLGENFDALREKIKKLGADTLFSATQAGEGAEFLAKAGFNAKQIIAALPATLQLATAGQLDLAKAGDIATNVMSSFSIAAEDFQQVVDAMAFTAANSNTDIRGLGSAFTFLGATSSSFGLSLNDALGAVAMMGNLGIQAGRAGRNLSSTIGELIEKSDELNLTFLDGNGKIESFAAILESIQDSGMTTTDIVKNFGQITSRTILALQSAGANMEEVAANARQLGLDVFDASDNLLPMEEVIEAIIAAGLDLTDVMPSAADAVANFVAQTDASGINVEKLATIATNTGSSVDVLTTAVMGSKETFEGLGLTSASAVAAILKLQDANISGADASTLFNKALTQLSEGADNAHVDITMISGGMDELANVMQELQGQGFDTNKVIEMFGEEAGVLFETLQKDGIDSFRELTEEMRETTGAAEGMGARMEDMKADNLTGDVQLLKSAFKNLQIQLSELGSSDLFRQIVQGITTLVKEAGRFVTENEGAIRNFFSELGTKIPGVIRSLKSQVGPILGAIGKAIGDGANRFVEFAGKISENKNAIVSTVQGIGQALAVVRDMVLGVAEAFVSLPGPVQKFIVQGAGIAVVLGPIVTLISGFSSGLIALGATFFKSASGATGLKAVFASLVSPVGLITAAITLLAFAWINNFGGIQEKTKEVFNNLKEKFAEMQPTVEKLKPVIEGIATFFVGLGRGLVDAFVTVVEFVGNAVIDLMNIGSGVLAFLEGFFTLDFSKMWDGLKEAFGGLINFLAHTGELLFGILIDIAGNLASAFNEGLRENWDKTRQAVSDFFGGIVDWVKDIFGISSPSTIFMGIGKNIVEGLINGIQNLLGSARNTITNFGSNVLGWFKNTLGIQSPSLEFLAAGQDIVAGLIGGIEGKQGEASDAAKKLAQETLKAFKDHLSIIKTNLELDILTPEDALPALQEMKMLLLQQVQALKEAGETGTTAFVEIASSLNSVQSEIDGVNKKIEENIQKVHGVTEITTAWLNKLETQAELKLRPLTEIFDELKIRAEQLFSEIQALQEGGLTPTELPIFEALTEKHAAVVSTLNSVESKLLEVDKLEQQIAAKAIENSQMTVEARIKHLDQRLSTEKLTVQQIKLLEDELAQHVKAVADEKAAFDKAYFDARREESELSEAQILAHLQAEVIATKKNTAERVAAEKAVRDAERQFAQDALDFEAAQIARRAASGKGVLQAELALINKRIAAAKQGSIEREQLETQAVAKQKEINDLRIKFDDDLFALRRAKGEASLQDEIAREQARLATITANTSEFVAQEMVIFNLQKQATDESKALTQAEFDFKVAKQKASRKEIIAFLQDEVKATKEGTAERTAAERAVWEAKDGFRKDDLEKAKAHEQALFEFRKLRGLVSPENEIARLRQIVKETQKGTAERVAARQALHEAKQRFIQEEIAGEESAFRHRLATGELGVQAHIGWLNQQIEANRDNIEKRRELELELKDVIASVNQSLAEQLEQQAQMATESAEKQAELRGKFAESMAQRQTKIAEDLHAQGLELNQEGLSNYIDALKARKVALEFENKQESEEFKLLQQKLTEVEEVFTERRVSLAKSEAKQKLAQGKLSADGYIKELSRLASSEEFSVEQRIDLVRELTEFKEDQGKMSLDTEIKLLEKLLNTEGVTGEEIKDINEAVADFTIMQSERRTEESEKNLTQDLEFEIEVSKEKVKLGKITLEQQLSFLEQLLDSTEFTADQRKLIESAIAETIQDLARENRRVWEETTDSIVHGLEKVADGLRSVSPIAASVFDFLADAARNVIDRLEEVGSKSFTIADALGTIGVAAESSSNIAIKALGGLASAAANFATGNIIGGIAGAISTGVGFIAGLFGGGSKAAKEQREELERLRKEAVAWADQVGNSLKSVLSQFDTQRFLESIIGGLPVEKLDDFIKVNIEKILDFRERFVKSLEGTSGTFKRNFFDPLTGEFTDNSKNFLNFYSDFAGKFAGEVQRLQDQLAFAIKSRIAGGSFNISGLEKDLEEALRKLEGWTAEFQRAADFLGSSLSSGLFEALTNPNVSIAEAGSKLQDSFQQFVIKTIVDMAVQTALATGVVAAKMADLREKISEAFQTGNWAGVRESVGTIASDLSKMFTDLAANVGGALDDVFGQDLNAQATLSADTIENTTRNVTVNLDQQGIENFKTGVEKLEVFNDSFLSGIDVLGLKLDTFSMSADSLNAEFAPSISSSGSMFDSAANKFDNSVNVFQGSVQTFDETTRRDAAARENANREQAKLLEEVTGTTVRATFAKFRGRKRSVVQ